MPLLLRWEAADGDACWELFSAAESASSLSGPAEQQRQQEWLEAQLRRHYAALGSSASGACWDGEAAALGCLLALGPRGLRQWEQLAQEAQQRPLAPQQRRRALLLGLTAAGLLALQPADFDPAALAPAVAAAEARLAAPPAELLRLALLHRQEHKAHAAAPGSSTSAGEEDERSASAGTSEAGGSAAPTPRAAVVAAAAAEAAAAAAQRFNGMLASAADAEELQALLPGIDAAAALAGGSEGRRQLVLHMAATAARPPSSRPASAQRGASPAASPVTASLSPASSARRRARAAGGSSAIAAGRDRLLLRRGSSRKKVEDGPPLPPQPAVARGDSAADSALGGSPVGPQQEAAAMRGMLRQALQLANKLGVAAWEVHAAFVEALLLRPGQQWQPQGATAQLLEASAQQLLASQQAAAALLRTLLLRAWPAASSSCAPHLLCILQLLQRCGTALAASEAAAEGAGGARWQQAAALFAACQAGEQLLQAGGLDAKLFLQPIIDVLAEGLEAGDADEAMLPAAAAAAATAATAAAAAQQAPDPAALAQELLGHVSAGNAPQLAAAVAQLEQQYSVAAAAAANGAAKGAAASYPCSPSTVFLALFCKHVASGTPAARMLHGPDCFSKCGLPPLSAISHLPSACLSSCRQSGCRRAAAMPGMPSAHGAGARSGSRSIRHHRRGLPAAPACGQPTVGSRHSG